MVNGSLVGRVGAEGGPLDLINGIPVHPLVVHVAVVFVPLAALGVIVMAFAPKFSRRFGWLVSLAALVAAGSSFLAKEAGEQLAARIGEPGFNHAELGDVVPVLATLLLIVTAGLWLMDRRADRDGATARRGLRIAVAVAAVLVALVNLVWIYRVGDSGAKSVWSGEVPTAAAGETGTDGGASATPSATPSPTGASASPSTSTAGVYTMAQVATHNTAADCWAAIGGNVYDLTSWIDQHPGGPQRIINLCGTDGTAAFDGQHGGQADPAAELATLQVGTLG